MAGTVLAGGVGLVRGTLNPTPDDGPPDKSDTNVQSPVIPSPPATMKTKDGRTLELETWANQERDALVRAMLTDPGDDWYLDEFAAAGPRAPELAGYYVDLMTYANQYGRTFPTISSLENLGGDMYTGLAYFPAENLSDAICRIEDIVALQNAIGTPSLISESHPLFTTMYAIEGDYYRSANWGMTFEELRKIAWPLACDR